MTLLSSVPLCGSFKPKWPQMTVSHLPSAANAMFFSNEAEAIILLQTKGPWFIKSRISHCPLPRGMQSFSPAPYVCSWEFALLLLSFFCSLLVLLDANQRNLETYISPSCCVQTTTKINFFLPNSWLSGLFSQSNFISIAQWFPKIF